MIPGEAYQLVRLSSGVCSVRSVADRETFHPVAGPSDEPETLYVSQLRLAERMRQCEDEFVIWDVGLGSGANPLAALRCTVSVPTPLRVISFDRTTAALDFALRHACELPYVHGYEETLRDLLRAGRASLPGRLGEWEIHVGDFPAFMAQGAAALAKGEAPLLRAPDAIFFDAYSPARNPDMWTLALMKNIRAQLVRPCSLATYSRSTIARTALLLAGFYVGVGEPLARKEETTVAANDPALIPLPLDGGWLTRARRSHSAEPLHSSSYRQQPLMEESWRALQSHPQFDFCV